MIIKIGDKYEIRKDKYQFVLTKFRYGENDKGEKTVNKTMSYYSTLKQIAKELIFNYPHEAKTLDDLHDSFYDCVNEIEAILSEPTTRQP